jgi:hypothetical protein
MKEMDIQFEESMKTKSNFYYDTLRQPKDKDFIMVETFVYDTINGIKRLEKHSSGGGYAAFGQIDYLDGKVYKTLIDIHYDSLHTGQKLKPFTLLYYVVGDKFIVKDDPGHHFDTIFYRAGVHLHDSIAKKISQKLNLK